MYEKVLSEVQSDAEVRCTYCGAADRIVRRGFRYNRRGITQRYACAKCGKRFVYESVKNAKHKAFAVMEALDLYFRGLSLRQVSEHLAVFSKIRVSYTTIMRWIRKFSEIAGRYLDNHAGKAKSERWATDETIIRLNGRQILLWTLIDERTRYLISLQISLNRTGEEARKILTDALNRSQPPLEVITYGAPCYLEAVNQVLGNRKVVHIIGPGLKTPLNNNRVERLHRSLKTRIKAMGAFRSAKSAAAFAKGYKIYYNYMKPHRTLGEKTPAEYVGLAHGKLDWRQVLNLVGK